MIDIIQGQDHGGIQMRKMYRKSIVLAVCVLILMSNFVGTALATGESTADSGAKLLAVTFDDGPSVYTEALLDGLKERGVKATFFIVGNRAARYFDIIERMRDEGHQIANHTYSHRYLAGCSVSEIRYQVEQAKMYLDAAAGDNLRYFRLPGGIKNDTVLANIDAPVIGWAVDTRDWEVLNATKVKNHMVRYAEDGDIILLHDLYRTSVQGALMAIDVLLEQGYEFVTVEELFARRGIVPENGVVYYNAPNTGINLPDIPEEGSYTGAIENHWAYSYMKRLEENGIIKLTAGRQFAPEKAMTKADLAVMLGRLAGVADGEVYDTGMSDVPNDVYFASHVMWAVENGILSKNYDGTFGTKYTVTREQMITALTRYINKNDRNKFGVDIPSYEDASEISSWAKESVDFFKYTGLLDGDEKLDCRAEEAITRAEASELICSVMDYMKDPMAYVLENGFEYVTMRKAEVELTITKNSNSLANIISWFASR